MAAALVLFLRAPRSRKETRNMAGQQKLQSIQILRGIAASLIVVYHAIFYWFSYHQNYEYQDSGFFLAIGVDIFFVISGFIMMYVTEGAERSARPALEFLWDRISRIVPVYWIYTFFVILIAIVSDGLLRSTRVDVDSALMSLLFIPFQRDNGLFHPILIVGWTLNYEMFFYAIFAIGLAYFRKYKDIFTIFVILVITILSNITINDFNLASFYGNSIVINFLFGIVLFKIYNNTLPPKRIFLQATLVISVFWILLSAFGDYPKPELRFVVWGIPSLALVYFSLYQYIRDGQIAAIATRIGDASYSLYLSHPFVVAGCAVLFKKAGIDSFWLFLPTSFLLSLAWGHLSFQWIERPSVAWARSLPARIRRLAAQWRFDP